MITRKIAGRRGLLLAVAAFAAACGDGPTAPKAITVAAPSSPVISTISAGDKRLVLAFLPPTSDGGSPIVGCEISVDDTDWVPAPHALADGLIEVQGLLNGRNYSIRLRAVNSIGAGPAASVNGTPVAPPTRPSITEIASADKSLLVAFAPPSDLSGLSVITYEYSLNSGAWTKLDSGSAKSPIVISGLVNGTPYSVRLRAATSVGVGEESSAVTGIPMTVPGAPEIARIVGEVDRLRANVTVPLDSGGAPVTGFQYTLDGGTHWVDVAAAEAQSLVIANLSWETEYTVRVRAVNRMGAGPGSKPASAKPLGLARAPLDLKIAAADAEVRLGFSPATVTAGLPITAYQYSVDSGATWISVAPSSFSLVIPNLVNGTSYWIALRLVTDAGPGFATVPSQAMPFVESPAIDSVRVPRKPGISLYKPQRLDMLRPGFADDLARALQRYRNIHGRDAHTVFEKVQAAADYVSNMAKHPFTHSLGQEFSDARAWEYADYPEKLSQLAKENQSWNGTEWVPAAGKTLLDVPAIECSFQDMILGGIVNAIGAQWMLVAVTDHDAFAYYDFELGKWVYIESSYNEHYRAAGSDPDSFIPLSPDELRQLALEGENSAIAVQHPYQARRTEPEFMLMPYVQMHPLGFRAMMADVNGISVGARASTGSDLRVLPGEVSENTFAQFIAEGWSVADPNEDIWAPQGETFLDSVQATPRGNVVSLSSNLAVGAPVYERSVNGGAWVTVPRVNELNGLTGEIRFRARFAGFVAGEVVLKQGAQ